MTPAQRLTALRRRHHRLETVARAVVEDARAYDDGDQAVVQTFLLRQLIRELDGEPQPTAFATMSVS